MPTNDVPSCRERCSQVSGICGQTLTCCVLQAAVQARTTSETSRRQLCKSKGNIMLKDTDTDAAQCICSDGTFLLVDEL